MRALRRLFADLRPQIVHSFDTKPNLLVPLAARSVARLVGGAHDQWPRLAVLFAPPAADDLAAGLLRRASPGREIDRMTVFQNRVDQGFFESHGMLGRGGSRVIAGSGSISTSSTSGSSDGPSAADLRRGTRPRGGRDRHHGEPDDAAEGHSHAAAGGGAGPQRSAPRRVSCWSVRRRPKGAEAHRAGEIARHAPYVIATGRRQDVPALLAMADVFAFPTEYREGRAAGAAGSRAGRVADRDDRHARLQRRGARRLERLAGAAARPGRLATGIVALLDDRARARAMADRAARIVADEFGLARNVALYASAYRELLNGERNRMRHSRCSVRAGLSRCAA